MQTSFITMSVGLVAIAAAMPAMLAPRQTVFTCSAGSAECCSVDVLGLADLDCAPPPTIPTNATDFSNICAAIGQIDMCCDIPILGQGLICAAPTSD
ncbi:Cryparin [Lachnellula suecica]|uniref:Cryparin n=1 Tax=Lachnellula suecica TaxID=602035 RepID=A0A8T9BY09_9HELO|nr:Cryparin [Lachnellula suecica]